MSKIVERAFDFLELFADERRPLPLSEVANLLSIPLSSAHDVVRSLLARGYLYEVTPRVGYYPTSRLHDLATVIAEHDPVIARAASLLRWLRDTLDETVLLSKVRGLTATYLLAFETSHQLRLMVKVGDNIRGLFTTSAGKALLGSLDPAALEDCLSKVHLTPVTPRTITTLDAFRADLEVSRARGWYLSDGESLNDVTTLSARFTWSSSIYIVTIVGPSSRMAPRLEASANMLVHLCQLLATPGGPPAPGF